MSTLYMLVCVPLRFDLDVSDQLPKLAMNGKDLSCTEIEKSPFTECKSLL